MKTIIIFLLMLTLALGAKAQNYVREGKQFTAVKVANNSSTGELKLKDTGFTFKDTKGKTYNIYISKSGSCFIIKTSAKTGKEYKYYMKPELSEEICKELGVEYKSTRKK